MKQRMGDWIVNSTDNINKKEKNINKK